MSADNDKLERVTLVYSVKDVLKQTGLSRPTLYKEINSGRLRTFKVGTRRLISAEALTEWIRAREKATTTITVWLSNDGQTGEWRRIDLKPPT